MIKAAGGGTFIISSGVASAIRGFSTNHTQGDFHYNIKNIF